MKKNFFLTLMLGLLCIATGRAQFAPEAGKMYALKEATSGLYLDIQTLGINEANANGTTNNINLNTKPCVIYFSAGTTDNTKWTMKNVNGTYAMQASSRNWNAVVGTTAYEWTIAETGTDTDLYTIARSDGKFISMDTPTSGAPLFCDKGTGLKFQLVEYSALQQAAFTLKSPLSGVAKGAIQSAAQLNAITTATKIVIQNVSSNNSFYLAANSNQANIENAVLVWEPVNEGTPGTYYLRTTDAENGYIQAATGSAQNVTLGAKAKAQVFVATAPTTGNFTSENLVNADKDNLVRIQQNGASTWLNCNSSSDTPQICHTGTGGFTVHNVYLVVDATYLNLTTVSTTAASMQATPTEFYIIPSADTYLLQNKANTEQYVGYTAGETRDATTSVSFWKILADDDNDGFAQIARGDDAARHLGSDEECVVNKGVYTNVGTACNGWRFEGVYDNYTTTATNNGGKYEFTSGLIYTAGPCNRIRFTLTESGAYYSNSAKRLSFDSFVLYDAAGNVVPLTAGNVTGNNGKVYDAMLNGTEGTYTAGTWDNASATDDWFEIDLSKVDLKGAFKFSFVTENTTMNAKAFEIKMSYEKPADYIFGVNAPDGKDYSVTYNGEPIAAGDPIGIVSFDEELLVATEIAGYTWSVVVDDENETITLVYTEAEVVENPAAVVALLNRIGGDGTDAKFKIVLDPSMNSRQEVFVINGEDGKVLIKGTTLSAITTGIGWYLQNIAHINISWNSLNEKTVSGAAYVDLSSIPVPTAEEIHTSDAMYRYYLNTCAFGYSMTSWTWKRWQQEIDWMALHGINMPLQLVGLEEVWRMFLTMEDGKGNRKYGYTDDEAKAFVAGPAFIAWWAMNNLQGWGGTAAGTKSGGTWEGAGGVQDDAWYTRQKELAGKIVARQRELGMQPVIPGWSGMVPTNFASKSTYATRDNGVNWAGDFVRPLLLSVNNTNYAEIAADYYACLHEVMGESRYYSMDPFHEGGGAGTMEDYEALYAAMETANPGSQWVIQQWQWNGGAQTYSLTAVPAGRLIVLDLFSDGSPQFGSYGYNGYAPQDAVFCAIPNFGGRSGLMGRLTNLTDNYFSYKAKYSTIKGIGAAPEAIEQTPVTYDLIFQLPWMNGVKPDVAEWVSNYSIARYGVENEEIQEAWSLLRQGPLNYGADAIQGPVEDVWAAVPNLTANNASSWGATISKNWNGTLVAGNTYTKERRQMLIDATYKLLSQENAISGDIYLSNYNYDLVELGGGVLADYAHDLLLGINAAKTAAGENFTTDATYIARRDAFLQLILDVDRFKGTNLNFRLGKWTQEARDAAGEVKNATTATPDWYEYNNARTIVSTWSSPGTNLNDYSYRSWQGLMKDLYYPRWKYYFDNDCTAGDYNYFAWNWAHGKEHYVGQTAVSDVALTEGQAGHTSSYTREPEGNTVEMAAEVLGKYIIPVRLADGSTYYAYRCLSSDLNLTLNTTEGATLDLSEYITFGNTDGVTMSITSSLIDGTSTDLSAVTIKADACGDADSATDVVTVALSDGTSLTLTVVVNTSELIESKEALATLIEDMQELTAKVGTFDPLTEINLSTTEGDDYYIYSNAHISEGTIGNLLDEDNSTYIHTTWQQNSVDGLHHYLRVYLGEEPSLDDFSFSYVTRTNVNTEKPKQITVAGCDTENGTYTTIAILTNLPSASTITYESQIYSARGYKYLRFMVDDTYRELSHSGHKAYSMAKFDLFKVTSSADVFPVFDGTELTDDFAAARYDVLVDAINTYDYGTTAAEMQAAVSALQTAYNELLEKFNTVLPFKLTIDEEHPVLYNIISKRANDGSKVLQFDEESQKVAVAAKGTDKSYQAWYFVNSTKGFMIKPYNALGQVLSASSTGNNPGTVTVQDAGAETFYEWKLVKRTVDSNVYYNIQVHDGSNYFSNNGGEGNKMGFWSGDPDSDGGSLFKFVEAEFSNDNPRYYQLKDFMALYPDVANVYEGTSIGLYTGGAEYREAYTLAAPLNAAGNISDATECYVAYKALRPAAKALSYNAPDPDKAYYIVSASTNDNTLYCKGKYVYSPNSSVTRTRGNCTGTHNHTNLIFDAFTDITNKALAAFQFEETGEQGKYKMKNLNSGLYVKSFTGTHMGTASEAAVVTIAGYADGQVTLKVGDNVPMHAQNDYGVIVQWEVAAGNASLWTIDEVTDVTDFNYTLTVPASGVATLCLPYNVVLPDGVTAYTVKSGDILPALLNDDYYYEELVQVAAAGEKLAKGTAVIIKAAADDYEFTATMDNTDAVTADSPALTGTYYVTNVNSSDDTKRYNVEVEDAEVLFTAITAETAFQPYSSWLETTADAERITVKEEPQDIEIIDGAVYRIHGRLSNGTLRTLYNNGSNNRIAWTTDNKDDVSTLFIAQAGAEGKFKLVSALGNGIWSQDANSEETGVELTFSAGSVNGATMIVGNNNRRFNVYGSGTSGNVDFYSNCNAEAGQYVTEDHSTNFVMEPVDDATLAKYSLKMKKSYEWSTLYLPYAVTVPTGVKAYIATGGPVTVEDENVIQLTEVGGVVPAYTAVVLNRESSVAAETFNFVYTTEAATTDVSGNIFKGRITEGYIGGTEMASKNFYILFRGDEGERMYCIYKEYDSNGNQIAHNDNGYIKCAANKAYLALDTDANNASSYSFRFPGTTGIEEVKGENGNVKAVYDLQGRRLTEITEPGVYIIDGKKVLVK